MLILKDQDQEVCSEEHLRTFRLTQTWWKCTCRSQHHDTQQERYTTSFQLDSPDITTLPLVLGASAVFLAGSTFGASGSGLILGTFGSGRTVFGSTVG